MLYRFVHIVYDFNVHISTFSLLLKSKSKSKYLENLRFSNPPK